MKLTGAEVAAVKSSGPATHRVDVQTMCMDSKGEIKTTSQSERQAWFITSTPAEGRQRYFYMDDDGELFYDYSELPKLQA